MDFGIVQGAAGRAAPVSPRSLPTTGSKPATAEPDVWPILGFWFVMCGAAFIALTALAPRAHRK